MVGGVIARPASVLYHPGCFSIRGTERRCVSFRAINGRGFAALSSSLRSMAWARGAFVRKAQRRDFFVVLAPYITDEERERFAQVKSSRLRDALGPVLFSELVSKVRGSASFRQELLGDMRRAAWWIRNARWSERLAPVAEVAFFWEALTLLGSSGALADDVLALAHCMLAGCVCDGCDLASGARFEALQERPLVFGTLWADELLQSALAPSRGRVAPGGGVVRRDPPLFEAASQERPALLRENRRLRQNGATRKP